MLYFVSALTGKTKRSGYIITSKKKSILPFLKTHMVIYTTADHLRIVLLSQDPFDFASCRLPWIVLKILRRVPTYFDPTDDLGSYHFTVLSIHKDTHPLSENY